MKANVFPDPVAACKKKNHQSLNPNETFLTSTATSLLFANNGMVDAWTGAIC